MKTSYFLTAIIVLIATMFSFCSYQLDREEGGKQETSTVEEVESPYYYYQYKDGEYVKIYLRINTKYATLTLKEPQVPDDILQRGITASGFLSNDTRYWTELSIEKDLTDEQYFELLADIKRQNKDVIIGHYFSNLDGTKAGGTWPNFGLKIKQAGDMVLMEQMAEKYGCVISDHNHYDHSVYEISVTEETILNSMEIANAFFESELFDWVAYSLCIYSDKPDYYSTKIIH